jgi:hypothetical protein
MLRPEEEIAADIVRWLPRWAEVELDDERPVVAVWRDRAGNHRVIWYGEAEPSTVAPKHRSRFGDEPYWIVRFEPDAGSRRAALVLACDGSSVTGRVRWTFDVTGMPATETDVTRPDTPSHRVYHCAEDGWIEVVQERTQSGALVEVDTPAMPPIPELTAEPYPCGGFMADRAIRVVASVSWNSVQGRLRAVQQIDGTWRSLLVTFARIGRAWSGREQTILSLGGDGIAPMTAEGWLEHPRVVGRPFHAIAELEPEGQAHTIDEHILAHGAVSPAAAAALVVRLAEVAASARARGVELGGLRPELVYVRSEGDRVELASILHRGPTFLAAARVGESILIPPAFPADFAASNDVAGLAQLLWYLVSGGHPFLAAGDLRWERAWAHFRNERRRPQSWCGPPALGALFDRFLFAPDASGRSLDELRASLRAVAAELP